MFYFQAGLLPGHPYVRPVAPLFYLLMLLCALPALADTPQPWNHEDNADTPSRLDMLLSADAAGSAVSTETTLRLAAPPARPSAQPAATFHRISPQARQQRPFGALVAKVATEEQLDEQLLHAIISVESGYQHLAVSHKGAVGLMQVMPATANRFGVNNLRDPQQNLRAGARYLKFLHALYHGDMTLVLAAYNAGEGAVNRFNNRVPPFAETQAYVQKVFSRYPPATAFTTGISEDGRMGWAGMGPLR